LIRWKEIKAFPFPFQKEVQSRGGGNKKINLVAGEKKRTGRNSRRIPERTPPPSRGKEKSFRLPRKNHVRRTGEGGGGGREEKKNSSASDATLKGKICDKRLFPECLRGGQLKKKKGGKGGGSLMPGEKEKSLFLQRRDS